nr:unnamed protein product [Digitaria exilis]
MTSRMERRHGLAQCDIAPSPAGTGRDFPCCSPDHDDDDGNVATKDRWGRAGSMPQSSATPAGHGEFGVMGLCKGGELFDRILERKHY